MIQIGKYCIINADSMTSLEKTKFPGLCPVTCGLSIRSTVTASSISEEGFIYCLQRSIFDIYGEEIAPQEFKVLWHCKPDDIYPYLELVTLLLLCRISTQTISQLLF